MIADDRTKEVDNYIRELLLHSEYYIEDFRDYCDDVKHFRDSESKLVNVMQEYFPSSSPYDFTPIYHCVEIVFLKRKLEAWCHKIDEDDDE